MKINKLNVGQICSVKSYINSYCNYYQFKKAKKIFFFWLRKEGYYYTMTLGEHIFMTIEEIEANGNFICKDERVYYKPHLEIKMSNQNTHEKYFETEKELQEFMETDVMKGVNWING